MFVSLTNTYRTPNFTLSLTFLAQALRIKFRPGRHHGFIDPQSYFDWFDYAAASPGVFSRSFLVGCAGVVVGCDLLKVAG
jgi:hypothetical protein